MQQSSETAVNWEALDGAIPETTSVKKNAQGIYMINREPDLERMKYKQERLRPWFKDLFEAAQEVLKAATPEIQRIGEVTIDSRVFYRPPEQPHVVAPQFSSGVGHAVILKNFCKYTHPIVDTLFPSWGVDEAPPQNLRIISINSNKQMSRASNLRLVYPEAAEQILHCIDTFKGPITAFHYVLRPFEMFPSDEGTPNKIGERFVAYLETTMGKPKRPALERVIDEGFGIPAIEQFN